MIMKNSIDQVRCRDWGRGGGAIVESNMTCFVKKEYELYGHRFQMKSSVIMKIVT